MASYSDSSYSDATYTGFDAPAPGDPLTPLPIPSEEVVPGPGWGGGAITPASIDSEEVVPGPQPVPDVAYLNPITPASIDTAEVVPGPIIGPIEDPDLPSVLVGTARLPIKFEVPAYPDALSYACQPRLNEVGSGELVIRRKPGDAVMGEIITYKLLGQAIFTGRVTTRVDTIHDAGEEATQTLALTVDGLLREWEYAVVLPDFGAQETGRLGPPIQDSRTFDWTMNGLGTDDAEGVAGINIIDSIGMTNRYGRADEVFPLPDVWPAPDAQWMWVADPRRTNQPAGYCHFRIPFGIRAGKAQVWCCAFDYAEVWMDGVLLLTCDKPGVSQRIDIDVRSDFHLITIRAYNGGGKAGVLAAVLPVNADGLYDEPAIQSGGGWKALAYPTRTFRLNAAQVLRRLVYEARRRGVRDFQHWEFDFNESVDSAGRPWPARELIILDVGMTYLDVLRRLSEDQIDFVADPSRRRLKAWVKGTASGINRMNAWEVQDELESLVREQTLR